jgi:5-methylthioribose kinase
VLRTALTEGARFNSTSQQVGDLVGQVTFATSVAGMGARDRARLLADSVNPLLAEVTEKYLLSDPFVEAPDNRHRAELDALVAELRADDRIRTAVSRLRVAIGSNAQALVHGDLHSGSVMVADCGGQTRVRVIDPEFAVVGPIGLDLGLYLGNVLLAALRARALGEQERAVEHADQVRQCWAAFAGAWTARWPDRVDVFLDDGWLRQHLSSVWDDSLGFAAVEIVRRIAAYSHAADIETLPDPVPASAAALRIARRLLLSPASLHLADGQPDPVAVGALVAGELS